MPYTYQTRGTRTYDSKSYLVPARAVSREEEDEIVYNLRARLVASALDKGIAPGEQNLIIRDCDPTLDLGFLQRNWRTGALLAGAGAPPATNIYLTNLGAVPTIPINRLLGFYKIVINDPNPVVDQITFRLGPAGGSALGIFDLTSLRAEMENIGFFKEPIIYEPNEGFFVTFWTRLAKAAPGEDISFGALICEVVGQTISPRPLM